MRLPFLLLSAEGGYSRNPLPIVLSILYQRFFRVEEGIASAAHQFLQAVAAAGIKKRNRPDAVFHMLPETLCGSLVLRKNCRDSKGNGVVRPKESFFHKNIPGVVYGGFT